MRLDNESRNHSTAVEWFYKAGMSYKKVGDRNRAMMTLDRIRAISPGHPLGEELRRAIYPGGKKSALGPRFWGSVPSFIWTTVFCD